MNTILNERQLEEYYCTLCYAFFDFKRRVVTIANSGLPYPIRCRSSALDKSPGDALHSIELAGVPLGSFPGSTYDELTFDLAVGDLFVFFSDGVAEATDAIGRDFGLERLKQVIQASCRKPARDIVNDIFAAVQEFRGEAAPNDDMTAVAIRITA
jgi:sigma-B regulation protein RsbU (phosphoserine phosphatase)